MKRKVARYGFNSDEEGEREPKGGSSDEEYTAGGKPRKRLRKRQGEGEREEKSTQEKEKEKEKEKESDEEYKEVIEERGQPRSSSEEESDEMLDDDEILGSIGEDEVKLYKYISTLFYFIYFFVCLCGIGRADKEKKV
jgi:hypothetical protein